MPNNAPFFTSPEGPSATFTIPENETSVATLRAVDLDAGDTVTYTISGGADAALFMIDPGSGALSFVTAPDYEHPLDADGNNVYAVEVTASDGTDSVMQAVSVQVGNDNEAPVIDGGTDPRFVSYSEIQNGEWGAPAVTTIMAADPEGAALTYTLTGPDGGFFWISPYAVSYTHLDVYKRQRQF